MTLPLMDAVFGYGIGKKYGAQAAQFHGELVSSLRRASNELARDVLRRLIQDLNCGRFHDRQAKPKERRRLLLDSIRSIPQDGELKAWRKDILERLRHGQYSETP